jgi:hypothetical protein
MGLPDALRFEPASWVCDELEAGEPADDVDDDAAGDAALMTSRCELGET